MDKQEINQKELARDIKLSDREIALIKGSLMACRIIENFGINLTSSAGFGIGRSDFAYFDRLMCIIIERLEEEPIMEETDGIQPEYGAWTSPKVILDILDTYYKSLKMAQDKAL